MVHHAVPEKVISAIASISRAPPERLRTIAFDPPHRNWLHIGESLAAA
jgi:hypothetical protein